MGGRIAIREYGVAGPLLFLLHGGPGAPGYLAPLARALQSGFRVVEPMQRGHGPEPLRVESHVRDLRDLILDRGNEKPALVGHSWGAMLALAFASSHPGDVSAVVLIGCGTFDRAARARLRDMFERRMTGDLRARYERLAFDFPNPDERLREMGRLLLPAYSHDLEAEEMEFGPCDARAHHESWQDIVRLQDSGIYPAAFRSIRAPVLMLHGSVDPHPGWIIRDSLLPHIPQLEYREWEACGHYPWLERAVKDDFLQTLRDWLHAQAPPVRAD